MYDTFSSMHERSRERGKKNSMFQQTWYIGLLLAHCLRRWPNSKPTLGQRLIFAGLHTFMQEEKPEISDDNNIYLTLRPEMYVLAHQTEVIP